MARSHCEIVTAPRSRSHGTRFVVTVDVDRATTIDLIRDLAARIGMRVTLSPLSASDDGEGK